MVKDPTKIKTTWLLPRDLVKQAKQIALDNDISATAVVIDALTEYIQRKSKK